MVVSRLYSRTSPQLQCVRLFKQASNIKFRLREKDFHCKRAVLSILYIYIYIYVYSWSSAIRAAAISPD